MGEKGLGNKLIKIIDPVRDHKELVNLKRTDVKVIDNFEIWLNEAFIVNFPTFKSNPEYKKSEEFEKFCHSFKINPTNFDKSGNWVHYVWKNEVVHLLEEDLHLEVITARNNNLVTKELQRGFYKTNIGIAGLSVGQSAALTIATSGGGKSMSLADFDTLDPTNLNRIRAAVSEIGDSKCVIAAKLIYNINPFAELKLFTDGITKENINEFVENKNLLIDEIDNFQIKALLRKKAMDMEIPLVSAFDTSDGIVLDVERYDLGINQKPFFGNVSAEEFDDLINNNPNPKLIPRLVIKTMGAETIPDVFKSSILKVGTELAGVPQLGSTAFFAGVAVSFATRMISSGEKISGRFYLDLRKLTGLEDNFKLNESESEVFKKITG